MKNEIEIINQRDVELLEKTRRINLQKLFTEEGMNEIISAIKAEVKDFKADIATKEGRAEIVSMAFKIAKCKAPIENLASELKEDSRKLIDSVNAQWNRYKKEMDTLRDEIRKPVDEIEAEEKRILQEKHDRLNQIEAIINPFVASSVAGCQELMEDLENVFNFNWGDFKFKAEEKFNQAKNYLQSQLEKNIKNEAQQAELAQLKKEKEEREKKDREEQIAREAVEKARIEAEKREKKLAEEKRISEEEALILKRKNEMFNLGLTQDIFGDFDVSDKMRFTSKQFFLKDESSWQENLVEVKKEVEKVVEKRRLEHEKEKKRIENEAIERERNRVEAEKRKEAEALEKREANKKHRAKINNEVLQVINLKISLHYPIEILEKDSDLINFMSKAIIEAIARGEVPHVQINY